MYSNQPKKQELQHICIKHTRAENSVRKEFSLRFSEYFGNKRRILRIKYLILRNIKAFENGIERAVNMNPIMQKRILCFEPLRCFGRIKYARARFYRIHFAVNRYIRIRHKVQKCVIFSAARSVYYKARLFGPVVTYQNNLHKTKTILSLKFPLYIILYTKQ